MPTRGRGKKIAGSTNEVLPGVPGEGDYLTARRACIVIRRHNNGMGKHNAKYFQKSAWGGNGKETGK